MNSDSRYGHDIEELEISRANIFSDYQSARKFTGTCPKDLGEVYRVASRNRLPKSLSERLIELSKGLSRPPGGSDTHQYSLLLTADTLESFEDDTNMDDLSKNIGDLTDFLAEENPLAVNPGDADLLALSDQPEDLANIFDNSAVAGAMTLYPAGAALQEQSTVVQNRVPIFLFGDKGKSSAFDEVDVLNDYLIGKKVLVDLPVHFMDKTPAKWFSAVQKDLKVYVDYMITGQCDMSFKVGKYEYTFYVYKVMMTAVCRLRASIVKDMGKVDSDGDYGARLTKALDQIDEFIGRYGRISVEGSTDVSLSYEDLVWSYLTGISTARKAAHRRTEDPDAHNVILTKIDTLESRVTSLNNNVRSERSNFEKMFSEFRRAMDLVVSENAQVKGSLTELESLLASLTTQVNNLAKCVSSENFRNQTPHQLGDYKLPKMPQELTVQEKLKQHIAMMASQHVHTPIAQIPDVLGIAYVKFYQLKEVLSTKNFPCTWHNVLALAGCFKKWPAAYMDTLPAFSDWYLETRQQPDQISYIINAVGSLDSGNAPPVLAGPSHTPSGTRILHGSW